MALNDNKEALNYYDYFCSIHSCLNQPVLVTEPLDDEELYCINLLETKGYLISTEISSGCIAILPMRREYNNVFFYCSINGCKNVNHVKHKD